MDILEVPRTEPDGSVTLAVVPYQLLDFPLPLELLRPLHTGRTEEQGSIYKAWAEETQPDRTTWFLQFLQAAGAPAAALTPDPAGFDALSAWVTSWYPHLMSRWRGSIWTYSEAGDLMYVNGPDAPGSRRLKHLDYSLRHDLGFLVVSAARRRRPELAWSLCRAPIGVRVRAGSPQPRYNVPTLSPSGLGGSPFNEPAYLLTKAIELPPKPGWEEFSGRRDVESPLVTLFNYLMNPEQYEENRPDDDGGNKRGGYPATLLTKRQFHLRLPRAGAPAPEPELVEAVGALRRAGWYAKVPPEWTAEQLAAALDAAWLRANGEPLVLDESLGNDLLTLDEDRTLAFDVEADVGPGAMVYRAVLKGLANRSDGTLKVETVREDWQKTPGFVTVSFLLNGRRVELSLPDDLDNIDPGIVVEINRLLPADGPHFYFCESTGQMAVVTRAAEIERSAVESSGLVRLSNTPPAWWMDVRTTPDP